MRRAMTKDEFRVEITIRVVPRDTRIEVGWAEGDEVLRFDSDKYMRLDTVKSMAGKIFEVALSRSKRAA